MTIVRFYRKAGIYLYPIKSLEMRAVLKKEPGCLHPELCNGQEIQIQKNTLLFSEGESLDHFFVLKEGACVLSQEAAEGQEQILRILGPGDILGKRAFFTGEGSSSTARTLSDAVLVIYSERELVQSINEHPGLCHDLMGNLLQDSYRSTRAGRVFNVHLTITQRLAALIHYLASKFGTTSSNELCLQLKRQEMAAVLGTSPEYITNLLNRFKSWGIIREYKNRIQLENLEVLEETINH